MATRNKFPKYVMNSIKSTLIMKMVDGDFGFIPRPGQSGPRETPGVGFYDRAQKWVKTTYGKKTGQGVVNSCIKEALKIQNRINPARAKGVTSTMRATAVTIDLMLTRLSQAKVRVLMTPSERAFVASLKAFKKEASLSNLQQQKVRSLYNDIYIKRYKKM